MHLATTFKSAVLALATVAASCASTARDSASPGGVYLVGVAGAG